MCNELNGMYKTPTLQFLQSRGGRVGGGGGVVSRHVRVALHKCRSLDVKHGMFYTSYSHSNLHPGRNKNTANYYRFTLIAKDTMMGRVYISAVCLQRNTQH